MGNTNYPPSTLAVVADLTRRNIDFTIDGFGNITTHTFENGREVWTQVLTVH